MYKDRIYLWIWLEIFLFCFITKRNTFSCTENDKSQFNQDIRSQAMAGKANREDTFQVGYIDSCNM